MAFDNIFEPTSEAKQLENATGETVTGAASMGTTDQNAAKIAANQTPGVWTGAAPGSGVDGNEAIEDANMLPGAFVGEVSSDVLYPGVGEIVASDPQPAFVMDGPFAVATVTGLTLALPGVYSSPLDLLILVVVADNAGVAGVSSISNSITDATGNVWTRVCNVNRTAGVANDGTSLAIFTCQLGAAPTLHANATLTANFSPTTPVRIVQLFRATFQGDSMQVRAVGPGLSGSGLAWSTGPVAVELNETMLAFTAVENSATSTPDTSDVTGGMHWMARPGTIANGGGAATSQVLQMAYKSALNGPATLEFNAGAGSAKDWCTSYMVLKPSGIAA